MTAPTAVRGISAVTLATHDMDRAVRFYRALGLPTRYGGEGASFTSFALGQGSVNLVVADLSRTWAWWGWVIFYVYDVDDFYRRVVAQGLRPEAPPMDAPWGERFFHFVDPDEHELSFAEPLGRNAKGTPCEPSSVWAPRPRSAASQT